MAWDYSAAPSKWDCVYIAVKKVLGVIIWLTIHCKLNIVSIYQLAVNHINAPISPYSVPGMWLVCIT